MPEDVTPEQVLITDDGCYYYHRGAATHLVTGPDGKNRFCLQDRAAPETLPVDLTGVTLGAVPKS